MDPKNDYRTPKDRIEGELLREMLEEEALNTAETTVSYSLNESDTAGDENTAESCRKFPLAMAYVRNQTFEKIFDKDKAFVNGTIFKDLRLPFHCTRCYIGEEI